jgi:hypothetical protein
MASLQEKSQCVLWFHETHSAVTVQRNFWRNFGRPPPDVKSIKSWYAKFQERGSVCDKERTGRPRVNQDTVDAVRHAFRQNPRKSVRKASRELQIPRSTVHKILKKELKFFAYKLQVVQKLEQNDFPLRTEFANKVLDRLELNENYLKRICFSDEATFHVCGKVNRHNCRIWGSENPRVVIEHERDSPKVNVWCGVMHDRIIGPFFFAEANVNRWSYLDMLELYAVPQLQELQPEIIFQQDGAPPHWARCVRDFLNATFPERWIGRGGPTKWPPRSPDLTPLDFFLWGFVKDIVYSSPVADLETLKRRITNAVMSVTEDMLTKTWNEIENRLVDIQATRGAHIEVY